MKVSLRPHKTLPGWYTLDYRPHGTKGERVRAHYDSYEAAATVKEALEGGPKQTPTFPRLGDVVDEYLAWSKRNHSTATYQGKLARLKKHIIPFFGQYRVKDLSQRLFDQYASTIPKTTMRLDLSHISALVTWMVKRRYAKPPDWKPEAPQYSPRVKRLPTPSDIIDFITTLKKPVHREACLLMLQSGIRWDELRHLRWEQYREGVPLLVDRGRSVGEWVRMGELHLSKTKTAQDEPVTFPVTPWWDENQKQEGFIFSVRRGGMISTIHRQLKEHSAKTGIDMTPHMFRHACGTYLYEETGDIRAVQVQLRHSKLSTTEIYVRKSIVRKRESARALVSIFEVDKR